MQQKIRARGTLLVLAAMLAACGGGNDREDAVPTNYLAKFQGTWRELCANPIPFSAGVWGPPSVRKKFAVSAPDSTGRVNFEIVEEFFDTTMTCWDTTATPYATVRTTTIATAVYAGRQSHPTTYGTAMHDVLALTRPASAVQATGTGISSVTVSGTPVWRITFSGGQTVDRNQQAPALTSSALPLLKITVNNGEFYELGVPGNGQNFFQR
ncbi:MAG: hypothetical protein ABW190_14870 [Rhizobacter sp.]